ncbi:hypothetical protein UlMin_007889 [Ulmus minor]
MCVPLDPIWWISSPIWSTMIASLHTMVVLIDKSKFIKMDISYFLFKLVNFFCMKMYTRLVVDKNALLVDTKNRVRSTLPVEPHRRNVRLQLMCYKHMWNNLAAGQFSDKKFFDFFSLNPYHNLSEEIIESSIQLGFPAKTLDDVVRYYINTCSTLPSAQEQLLLRYESQQDNSLLSEYQFAYDLAWLHNQIHGCLEFWRGQREANYTPEEERWKCRYCQYAYICPESANSSTSSSNPTNSTPDYTTSSY